MRNLLALIVVAMVLAFGCNGEEDDYASEEEAQTPEARAKYNSEDGAAALAESDRGVDDEGEKTWKQEALEYYDLERNPNNRTFEMPRQWAIDFTKKMYAAGAEKVWVTRIFGEDFDELHRSGYLLAAVPTEFGGSGLGLDGYSQLVRRLAYCR